MAALSLLIATVVVVSNLGTTSAPPAASPSPRSRESSETLVAESLDDLPVTVRPYPYTKPTPAPVPSEIDGTYMLILGLEDLGGARNALPFPCVRCLPYARDPGVVTLIFFEGVYFVDHQMSGFHSVGHFEIDGDRLTLFNDPNCTRVRGTYTWQMDGGSLRLEVVDDPCAFEGERAIDLASDVWTKIPICRREVQHLWPGILGC